MIVVMDENCNNNNNINNNNTEKGDGWITDGNDDDNSEGDGGYDGDHGRKDVISVLFQNY